MTELSADGPEMAREKYEVPFFPSLGTEMRKVHVVFVALAVATLAVCAWLGWRWYTTPIPPELPLDRMDPAVAAVMQTALDEVRRSPRSGAAWGKLAMVTAANDCRDEALACLIQAERFDRENPRWPYLHGHMLLSGQPHEAFPLLRQALACPATREQEAAIRFRLALALIEDGRLDEAEQHLDRLRDLKSDGTRVSFGMALLAVARDDRPVARQLLESVRVSPFARQQAHARLAALALVDGDTARARFHQQHAAQPPPDIPWPDPLLDEMYACAVSRQSRFLEAEALEGRGRTTEAVALLRQIAAGTPDARSYLALGRALGNQGAYDEAEQVLGAVVEMDRTNLQAHHLLGTVLFLKAEQQAETPAGKELARTLFCKAVESQDQALAIQADHGVAHLMRGRALARLGRTKEALASLRLAAQSRPEFADVHLYLGLALAEADNIPEALPHLEDAVRLARPDDPRPRQALDKWRGRAQAP
jgi:tetratricopeptide (TPR) repeat protein